MALLVCKICLDDEILGGQTLKSVVSVPERNMLFSKIQVNFPPYFTKQQARPIYSNRDLVTIFWLPFPADCQLHMETQELVK